MRQGGTKGLRALAAAVLLAGCQVAPLPVPPPLPVDLGASLEPLRLAFNAGAGRPRVIALLSPSCRYSEEGLHALCDALERLGPEAELDVLLVWVDQLPGDGPSCAARVTAGIGDGRVQAFHDLQGRASRYLAQGNLPLVSASRALFLFGPDSLWGKGPPRPDRTALLFGGWRPSDQELPDGLLHALERDCLAALGD